MFRSRLSSYSETYEQHTRRPWTKRRERFLRHAPRRRSAPPRKNERWYTASDRPIGSAWTTVTGTTA